MKPQPFNEFASRRRKELAIVESFAEYANDDPDAAYELLATLSAMIAPAAKPIATTRRTSVSNAVIRRTKYDELKDWFVSVANEWHTVNAIVSKSGITRGSVRQILYKLKPDEFDRRTREGAAEVEWRLKVSDAKKEN